MNPGFLRCCALTRLMSTDRRIPGLQPKLGSTLFTHTNTHTHICSHLLIQYDSGSTAHRRCASQSPRCCFVETKTVATHLFPKLSIVGFWMWGGGMTNLLLFVLSDLTKCQVQYLPLFSPTPNSLNGYY